MNKGTILVTGATGGIGKATISLLAREGYGIIATASGRNSDALTHLAREVKRKYPKCEIHCAKCDLESETDIAAFFSLAHIPFARLTGIANIAGVSHGGDLFTATKEEWDRSLTVNLTAPFLVIRHAIPFLTKNKGSIVNISSMAGVAGAKKPQYAASKAGLLGLTKSVALSLGEFGIRVNAVVPGAVDTLLIADWDEQKRTHVGKQTHLGRIAEPREIAEIILFLLSDKSSYISGAVINATCGQYHG